MSSFYAETECNEQVDMIQSQLGKAFLQSARAHVSNGDHFFTPSAKMTKKNPQKKQTQLSSQEFYYTVGYLDRYPGLKSFYLFIFCVA